MKRDGDGWRLAFTIHVVLLGAHDLRVLDSWNGVISSTLLFPKLVGFRLNIIAYTNCSPLSPALCQALFLFSNASKTYVFPCHLRLHTDFTSVNIHRRRDVWRGPNISRVMCCAVCFGTLVLTAATSVLFSGVNHPIVPSPSQHKSLP